MDEIFQGGCYCGDIRFEVADIFDVGYCHCAVCHRFSGAPACVWANAPVDSFRITRGTPVGFASSANWERCFCSRCGCHVFGRYRQLPPETPTLIAFGVFNLDTPGVIRPTAHIWCSSQVSYFETTDDLPRFPEGTLSHPSKRISWRADHTEKESKRADDTTTTLTNPLRYLNETEQGCVRQYISLLNEKMRDNVVEVRLFGSAARGDMWN